LFISSSVETVKITRSQGGFNNLYYFAVGAIGTIIGLPDLNPKNIAGPIKACFPQEWLGKHKNTEENSSFKYAQNNNNVLIKFMNLKFSFRLIKQFKFSIDDIVAFANTST
jgi:hypothetical protein